MNNRLLATGGAFLVGLVLCCFQSSFVSAAPAPGKAAPGVHPPAGAPAKSGAGAASVEVNVNPGLIEDAPPTKTVKADGYNSEIVDNIQSDVVDKMWAQTDIYWHQGDYPRIIDLDKTITQIDPYFMEPYSTGAWLMESMGDLKNAEAYYRLGVANNPNDSYLYYNLSAFYFNTLKDYQSAATVMALGVTKKGNDINDWRMLAHAYERSKHIDDAIAAWKTVLKRFPDTPVAQLNLSRLEKIKSGVPTAPPPASGEISL